MTVDEVRQKENLGPLPPSEVQPQPQPVADTPPAQEPPATEDTPDGG
jgi:hypothetical protein